MSSILAQALQTEFSWRRRRQQRRCGGGPNNAYKVGDRPDGGGALHSSAAATIGGTKSEKHFGVNGRENEKERKGMELDGILA